MRNLDIKTKYFDQNSFQIPQLTNTWGCMIDLLDKVLVHGTEPQNVISITIKEDLKYPTEYWIATVTLNVGHGFKKDLSVVEIQECIIPEYNQRFRVQDVTATTIDIAFSKKAYPVMPRTVPGTLGITIKQPPLGYEKSFEGFQKAAYKCTLPDEKFCYLRVDNSCPQGYTQSWIKISRVTMLSEMKHIDDYQYIRGRKKAPALIDDYNFNEEDYYAVWINVQSSSSSTFPIRVTSHNNISTFMIFGDSESFYFYIPEHRYSSINDLEDTSYLFGKYIKYIYKEDPKPFILKAAQRDTKTATSFDTQGSYPNITRDRTFGKFTFSTKDEGLLETDMHEEFGLHLADTQLSGTDTRINFLPYKNEINIILTPFDLRFFRPGNTVLEGRYRGVYSIVGNIRDAPHLAPQLYEVFENSSKHFIRLPSRHYGGQGTSASVAILLNDWS